jgi:biopolymer transport protein ExbB/TolQ
VKKRTAALDAVKRALERSAAIVHGEMKRGLNSLASVAATAPLVGFFGTVLGALGSFKGLGTEKSSLMSWMARDLSESLAPTALGLFVGVLAFCLYRYLLARLENFDIEMKNGSLQLMDELARLQKILPSTHG